MATHYSILTWRIPWTEKPGGLQSMGLQRVGHNWATNTWFIYIAPHSCAVQLVLWLLGFLCVVPSWWKAL